MLEHCQSAKERWGGVSEIIDKWLQERQELLVMYCELGAAQADSDGHIPEAARRFCEILLDYVSAGHFEVYEQLFREAKEFDDGGIELARELYPAIEVTTGAALRFNDYVDQAEDQFNVFGEFQEALSSLGEKLEERFSLEDKLIARLHTSHADLVA